MARGGRMIIAGRRRLFPLRGPPPRAACRRVEVVGLGAHPGDEARKLRIVAQRRRVGKVPGDLRLGVAGVDGGVADLVQPDGAQARAALELGGQVVEGGAGLRRDGPAAEGAADEAVIRRLDGMVSASHAMQVGMRLRV